MPPLTVLEKGASINNLGRRHINEKERCQTKACVFALMWYGKQMVLRPRDRVRYDCPERPRESGRY